MQRQRGGRRFAPSKDGDFRFGKSQEFKMERDRRIQEDGLQDCGTGLLEELLNFFESEASILDNHLSSTANLSMLQPTDFVSAIKFHGRPILPPVMTDERYEEMAMYKRQAIFTETRLKARTRQKLLSRVQNIVDGMNRPSSQRTKPGRSSPDSKSSTLKSTRPTSPPQITSTPSPDIKVRPITQESVTSLVSASLDVEAFVPDSLDLETSPPHKPKIDIPATKLSPKSEAKDSGISSQSQVQESPTEVSVVTTDPISEGPQDTMAEIDDISDDDNIAETSTVSSELSKASQFNTRQRTVAERLGSAFGAFKKDNELKPAPPVVAQTSARSSASGTASTASTDTTLQHTVLVQALQPSSDTPHSDITVPVATQHNADISIEKTDESMTSAGLEAGFEPLSSTRSLLSRVAFNYDDEENHDDDVQPKKIGDLSDIKSSVQSQEVKPVVNEDAAVNPSESRAEIGTDQNTCLSVGPVATPDLSQIEPADTISNAIEDQPPKLLEQTKESSVKAETLEDIPVPETTEQSVNDLDVQSPLQNNSDVSGSTPGSGPDVGESSRSTMFTVSTDIEKYMTGSQDDDTICSSVTTLPHILDESITISEVGGPGFLLGNILDTVSQIQPQTQIDSSPEPESKQNNNIEVPTKKGNRSGVIIPPKLTALASPPQKSAPRERLRRGSYTVDSPSQLSKLMSLPVPTASGYSPQKSEVTEAENPVLRRGSYTLASPCQALVDATQEDDTQQNSKVAELPKSAIGIIPTKTGNNAETQMNRSLKSEPPRPTQYELTSSMEDMKLKPVQRTLNFEDDSGSSVTQRSDKAPQYVPCGNVNNQNVEINNRSEVPPPPVAVGKEEHLQRYLQTLSQMPQLSPTQTSVSESGQSSPKDTYSPKDKSTTTLTSSSNSSPGQVMIPTSTSNGLGTLEATTGMTSTMMSGLTDDALSRSVQLEFEALQSQLLEQQQQQLAGLLQEQQRQQMVMQQEFLKYESMLLESSATEQDALLYQQLQERQRELLHTQMAMQQQLRFQMQQQRQQLQTQLLCLKQSHLIQPGTEHKTGTSGLQSAAAIKKTKRKKWQDQQRAEWVIEAQSDQGTSDTHIADTSAASSAPSRTGVGAAQNIRYFPEILPEQIQNSTDTTSSATYMPVSSRNTSRSGVSVGSDPFNTSVMSTGTDIHGAKKRVSFSTEVDTPSDAGSITSRSTGRSGAVSAPLPHGHYRVGGQYFPIPSIEPLMETAESANTSILSSTATDSPSRLVRSGYCQSPVSSMTSSRISKSSRGSPRSPRHIMMSGPKLTINDDIPPELHRKFDLVSAAVKGYLTRRLMNSDKVRHIIKTITDTAEFAIGFQEGQVTNQDKDLVDRVLAQLTSALYEIHEIFFEIRISERMYLIAQTRASERERLFKQKEEKKKGKRLSSATLKARERKKKARAAEMAVFGNLRAKSCPPPTSSPMKTSDLTGPLRRNYQYMMSRVLKPIQAHLSPIKPVKDTLNRNPLRSSYDKLYTKALKRAVAMEKKEQREKAALKQKPAMINTKNVKPKIDSHLGPKKGSPINNNTLTKTQTLQLQKVAAPNPRPKSGQQTHPWK